MTVATADPLSVDIVIGRAAYAATRRPFGTEHGSTGQSGPMETLPVSVPVPVFADRQPQFRKAAVKVMITSTKMKTGRLECTPGIPERWAGGGKRIAMQLTRVPVNHADLSGHHLATERYSPGGNT